jgi:gliding motility-associated-like protein
MIQKVQISCLFLLLSFGVLAQTNLVKNGGFDTLTACPSSLSQVPQSYWEFPAGHNGSSDLFNSCATSVSVGVPSNFRASNCPAFNGTGYVGGYGFLSGGTYREYVCDTLISPLVAGRQYVISFMWRLADQSNWASDDLGFYLSNNFPSGNTSGHLGVVPTSQNTSGNFLASDSIWELYSDTIIAVGGEEYITIGAFDSIPNAMVIDSTAAGTWAYYFYDSVSVYEYYGISQENLCLGESAFPEVDTTIIDSVYWDFGDPSSGALNNSTLVEPEHVYTDTGSYTLTVIRTSGAFLDTLTTTIYVFPRQTLDLGPDTLICSGSQFVLDVAQPFADFLWHDTSTSDTFLVTNETQVYVTINGVCDTLSDTMLIQYDDSILLDLGPDTTLCGGTSFFLDPQIQGEVNLSWSTGDSTDTISVKVSGVYSLLAGNACGEKSDSIEVKFKPIPSPILLPADTINCFDNEIVLSHPDLDSTMYVWSDSSTKKTYRVDTTETVWLAAFNECGATLDTIIIIFNPEIVSELGDDTTICDLDTLVLDAFSPGADYLWSTGDTIDTILTARQSELYVVTITQGLCQTIESKRVDLSDVLCPGIDCSLNVSNVFTPNGDGVNDRWHVTSDCKIQTFGLSIYNRWGQLVHYSPSAAFGWDGSVAGIPASEGVYYYELHFKDDVIVAVDAEDFRGSLTLLR